MKYKKYTIQAKQGVKGEAFFESLISDFVLPHKVVMPKDLGIDFICEWLNGDQPTGIIFLAQIKTITGKVIKVGVEARLNQLEKYSISNVPNISEETLEYWRSFSIPTYLFVIVNQNDQLNCYYKRFTPILTEKDNSLAYFYKVNTGNKFLAFKDNNKKIGGFARDLYIDYMRCNYYKGLITYLNPQKIGLGQFPQKEEGVIFNDLFLKYKDKICNTYKKIKPLLDQMC